MYAIQQFENTVIEPKSPDEEPAESGADEENISSDDENPAQAGKV